MPNLWTFAFLFTIGIGALVSYYYGIRRHTWGSLLGIALVLEGGFLLFANTKLSETGLIIGGSLGMMAIFNLTFFTFGRDSRLLLLLGIPLIILVEAYANYVLTLTLVLLVYMSLVTAIISAVDYSDDGITTRVRKIDGLLGMTLWVFFSIHRLLERIIERPSRRVIAVAYFGFITTVLVAAPLIVARLSGDTIPPEPLILVGLAYIYLTREAFARSFRHNGKSSCS